MATLKKWLNNRYVIGWSLVLWVTVDLVIVGWKCELSKSDWGTWVGSIGTIATFVGTIYLATAEGRQRSTDELVKARLHGASMVLRLAHAESIVGAIVKILDQTATIDNAPTFLETCRAQLDTINLWSIDELVPLAPLPENTALKLAQAADQLRAFRKILTLQISTGNIHVSEARKKLARELSDKLSGTRRFMNEAITVCQAGVVTTHLERAG
jgi:uncharacterized membrane protein